MTQKSSDQLLESLSALVDNEASELEVRRILKNIERNPEVRERWHRYNMIGAVLRKENDLNLGGSVDLVGGISAALASEQSLSRPPAAEPSHTDSYRPAGSDSQSVTSKSWFDFVAKSAVAASFAGALVIGFNMFSPDEAGNFGGATQIAGSAAQPHSQAVDPGVTAAPLGFDLPRLESRTVSSNSAGQSSAMRAQMVSPTQVDDLTDVATQSLLNELLIHHAARASSNGSLGIMPFARVSEMQQDEASK